MNPPWSNFFHLNVANRWPGFRWRRLELRPDGALQLCSLPVLDGDLPVEFATLKVPDGPAGVALDAPGNIYFSAPSENKVFRLDACDGAVAPLPCAGDHGDAPTQFRTPRGLLVPQQRAALFVADSGNHRLQLFDIATGQLIGVWGQAGTAPGQFDTPWTLAGDEDGNVYVVDYGNQRVQKFDLTGQVVPSFAENTRAAKPGLQPADIAIAAEAGETSIFILDSVNQEVAVFDSQGHARVANEGTGGALTIKLHGVSNPIGLAVAGSKLFVGDNGGRRVVQFSRTRGYDAAYPGAIEYEAIGEAIGYSGPVAALALDLKGGLLLHTGTVTQPLRLFLDKGYSKSGFFWSDAVSASPISAEWHRVVAQARGLSDEARLRLFVATALQPGDEPPIDQTAQNPFSNTKWRPRLGPPDPFLNVDEVFVRQAAVGNSFRKQPTPHLWVGGFVSGDGTETPVLRQLRVEYNHHGYLEHLPAIYRPPHGHGTVDARGVVTTNGSTPPSLDSEVNVDSNRTFLVRWLSLLEGTFGEVQDKIDSRAMLFDVAAVPHEFLLWLASWFALDLDETWDETRQRDAVRHAFARAGRRGTAEGLREALRVFAGVDAVIDEPILNAGWWILPSGSHPETGCACHAKESAAPVAGGDSVLGFTTMLASASPQGAVLGTSATLDQSHIIDGEDFGVPLFEAIAHQVSVLVPRGLARCEARRQLIRTVIEREKPTHVAYHLCLIEPQLRLGWQARVGMDAIVAGPTPPGKLDENFVLGVVTTGSAAGTGSPSTPERIGFIQLAG